MRKESKPLLTAALFIVVVAAVGGFALSMEPLKSHVQRLLRLAVPEAASWRDVELPESGYVIQMPSEPERESRDEFQQGVGKIKLSSAKVQRRTRIFLAQSIKFPEALKNNLNIPAILEDNTEGIRQDLKAEQIFRKPIRLGAHQGLEFRFKLPEQLGVKLYMYGRIYVIGTEICEILGTTNLEDPLQDPNIQFFIDSFRVKTGNAKAVHQAPHAQKVSFPLDEALKSQPDRTFKMKNGETVTGKIELQDEVHYAVRLADGSQKIVIKEDVAAGPS